MKPIPMPEYDPAIDSAFAAALAPLSDIDGMLFDSYHRFRDAPGTTERQAHYATFSQGVYELEKVLAHLRSYQAHMRDGINAPTLGKVIRLRRQPRAGSRVAASGSDALPRARDARGRFVKLTD